MSDDKESATIDHQDEWSAQIAALLVPQPFVVSTIATNGRRINGGFSRMGARVNAIHSQGTFVNNNPERCAMLDDISFV